MRLASALAPFTILAVAACTESPTSASGTLNGSWRTAPIPSGAGISMALVTHGTLVMGTGAEGGLMGRHIASISITGRAQLDVFSLTLTFDDGTVATYTGRFDGPDQLAGTWTVGTQATPSFVFYRQPS